MDLIHLPTRITLCGGRFFEDGIACLLYHTARCQPHLFLQVECASDNCFLLCKQICCQGILLEMRLDLLMENPSALSSFSARRLLPDFLNIDGFMALAP